jgi:peptidoglycan/xylan/chitin deacetylase (PgdA/CDA1 family)
MDRSDLPVGRRQRPDGPKPTSNAARLLAGGALLACSVLFAAIVLASIGGSGSHTSTQQARGSNRSTRRTSTTTSTAANPQAVPILVYNVINSRPAGSTAPASLYVPLDEFSAQMQALRSAGWHAVTLDQLEAQWAHGRPVRTIKPIVITFDGGYASQYTNALPVLKRLGWVAVENLPVTGLPSSEGGISDAQVRAMIAADWEIGVQGSGNPDLTTLPADQVSLQLTNERQTIDARYGVSTHWLAYAAGRYNASVASGARVAGFTGALTTFTGWASAQGDRFRLPRIAVLGGTSGSQLLSQIAAARSTTAAPISST